MGFWSSILPAKWFSPKVEWLGMPPVATGYQDRIVSRSILNVSPAAMWRTQPYLRTVVDFLARNVAHLGLHVYRRAADGGRERDRGNVLAQSLWWADGVMTTHDLIYALMVDRKLYDTAYWMVVPSSDSVSGWMIRRLPPVWVTPEKQTPFEIQTYKVGYGDRIITVDASQILRFPGFHPTAPLGSSPALEALRQTMQEQIESATYRTQIWKRGGRVSSVLQRPVEAEPWSDAAREAFREDWYAKYTGNGSRAGGTPILEDGMTLNRIDFSAQDQQFVEAAKLSLQTVAAAFHVQPDMVGMGEGSTYSNMRAFRKMLYTETLGPDLDLIEERLNRFLVPMLGLDPEEFYVEFNIAEKLQGDFEEQSAVLSTATGRPWMSANEARARQNLPAVPGGDALVVPLNVLVGGQASPTDSGTQNEVPDPVQEQQPKAVQVKAAAAVVDKHHEVLADFFDRQSRVVLSRMGAKADSWWDQDRWDQELAADLFRLAVLTATTAGRAALERGGFDEDAYDEPRTHAFLDEASKRNAANINEVTRAQLEAADDPAHVFEVAKESRAAQAAVTLAAFATGFGMVEAARQNSTKATKTWRVMSSKPRPSHARLDGVTVGLDDDFPNGLPWPGAAGSDADEVAGCTCEIVINF